MSLQEETEQPLGEDKETEPKNDNSSPDLEKMCSEWKKEERDRVLSLLDLTDNIPDLKKYIEKNRSPSDVALEIVKQLKKTTISPENKDLPSATLTNGGLSKAQETINLAKKYGV